MSTAPDISQLKEIALPAPVSYMPQTWGWLVLLAALLIALTAFSAWRYWHWRRNRYRREALLRMAELERAFSTGEQRLAALRELPALLKRVALSIPGDASAASLSGEHWQTFLQDRSREPLPSDFSRQLAQLAYAPAGHLQAMPDELGRALFSRARRWVETHDVAA
ncbi:MAG: DUF4381 domain-containing protein [Pseudomonas sp.]|uniref:DUF4381 domain-containing protein n=1 Tax=Pseudomonas sp. TaxID=306 RepID=UPI0030F0B03C